jgi:hypothetical protein
MSWKLVVLGGLAYYVVGFVIGMASGPLIHEGYLKPTYQANSQLWRPELNQDPPDMAALMPRWITTGLIGALISAWIYGWVRGAFSGPGWQKGLRFGLVVGLLGVVWSLGYSGVFNLTDKVWVVWSLEGFLYTLAGGAVMGWLAERFHW